MINKNKLVLTVVVFFFCISLSPSFYTHIYICYALPLVYVKSKHLRQMHEIQNRRLCLFQRHRLPIHLCLSTVGNLAVKFVSTQPNKVYINMQETFLESVCLGFGALIIIGARSRRHMASYYLRKTRNTIMNIIYSYLMHPNISSTTIHYSRHII